MREFPSGNCTCEYAVNAPSTDSNHWGVVIQSPVGYFLRPGRGCRTTSRAYGPSRVSWRQNQIAVVAATFVGFTGFTLVMPFLPRYIQELGVTDTGEVALWAGITLGITPGIVALCAPLWGRVADRFGNKLLVQRSLFSCIIVMALMAEATEPWHLVALRAAQGLLAG